MKEDKAMAKITVTDRYEHGDPGSPTYIAVVVEVKGRDICYISFPNEDNEKLMDILIDVLEQQYGVKANHKTEANPDFGYG